VCRPRATWNLATFHSAQAWLGELRIDIATDHHRDPHRRSDHHPQPETFVALPAVPHPCDPVRVQGLRRMFGIG
jgi:hypothetical protein